MSTFGFQPVKPGYGTSFSVNEAPLSESGHWRNGFTNGGTWHDINTIGGVAFGTQDGQPSGSGHPNFLDSVAILTGTWGSNQRVEANVFLTGNSRDTTALNEVELWVHGKIESGVISGFECTWSIRSSGFYGGATRWNGPVNSFDTSANSFTGSALQNGDHIAAEIVGNVITMFTNGVQVWSGNTATDFPNGSTNFQGNPGFGHWFNLNGTGASITASDFGLKNFSARNI